MPSRRRRWIRVLWGVLVLAVLAAWLGFKLPPAPFPAASNPAEPEVVPLPAGLPAPVDRFYRQTYGEYIPVITTAVISGRATLRPLPLGSLSLGPAVAGRFRFAHEAGRNYSHSIEGTWFGRPALRLTELYLNGVSRQQTPFGSTANDPQGAQAANAALWAEALWFPALYLTDSRVRWQELDDETAVLSVPFGDGQERFLVRFDPATGRPFLLEAMRYKDIYGPGKTLWLMRVRDWGEFGGVTLPREVALTWEDDGRPWAVLTAENVAYNVDVSRFLR